MDEIKILLNVCALVFVLACGVSVLISYFIMRARVAKNEDVFMSKIRELTDGMDSLKSDMAESSAKIDALDKRCDSIRAEAENAASRLGEQTERICGEIEAVKAANEKMNMRFADINDRLNVVDSTVKNIEHMKDFEINGAESPYLFDEDESEECAEAVKDKLVSAAQRAAEFVTGFGADALAGTAFGIVNAVKRHFNKE